MTDILLSGCGGKMGRVIARDIAGREDIRIAAGVDISSSAPGGFPVFSSAGQCDIPVDVAVDFSHPSALDSLLTYSLERQLPLVIATTGYSQEQVAQIHKAAEKTPIFFTYNMSLGVNLLAALAKKAARVLGRDFDIEIIEKHHNQKIDAPSGTAVMLAEAVASALEYPPEFVYERKSRRQKRQKQEIGIHSIRGGTIVGEHEILYAGKDETISLSHTAISKEVFATGAINAALFMAGKKPGLYTMEDLMK